MLPASGCLNKRLNNKDTKYRRGKERKAWEKYRRVNGYLKNTLNQKENTNSFHHLPVCAPLWEGVDY
jgi:hypothetical protein